MHTNSKDKYHNNTNTSVNNNLYNSNNYNNSRDNNGITRSLSKKNLKNNKNSYNIDKNIVNL